MDLEANMRLFYSIMSSEEDDLIEWKEMKGRLGINPFGLPKHELEELINYFDLIASQNKGKINLKDIQNIFSSYDRKSSKTLAQLFEEIGLEAIGVNGWVSLKILEEKLNRYLVPSRFDKNLRSQIQNVIEQINSTPFVVEGKFNFREFIKDSIQFE